VLSTLALSANHRSTSVADSSLPLRAPTAGMMCVSQSDVHLSIVPLARAAKPKREPVLDDLCNGEVTGSDRQNHPHGRGARP